MDKVLAFGKKFGVVIGAVVVVGVLGTVAYFAGDRAGYSQAVEAVEEVIGE